MSETKTTNFEFSKYDYNDHNYHIGVNANMDLLDTLFYTLDFTSYNVDNWNISGNTATYIVKILNNGAGAGLETNRLKITDKIIGSGSGLSIEDDGNISLKPSADDGITLSSAGTVLTVANNLSTLEFNSSNILFAASSELQFEGDITADSLLTMKLDDGLKIYPDYDADATSYIQFSFYFDAIKQYIYPNYIIDSDGYIQFYSDSAISFYSDSNLVIYPDYDADAGLYLTFSKHNDNIRIGTSSGDGLEIYSHSAFNLICLGGLTIYQDYGADADCYITITRTVSDYIKFKNYNSSGYIFDTEASNDYISFNIAGGPAMEISTSRTKFYKPIDLPSYDSSSRPASPDSGWMIWQSTDNRIEYYNGSGWYYLSGTGV